MGIRDRSAAREPFDWTHRRGTGLSNI